MLLIVNCMVDSGNRINFNQSMARLIDQRCHPYRIINASNLSGPADLSPYTRLLISGSEASALDDNPWNDQLMEVIRYFITHRLPLLGICYGHQFLARTLAGKSALRKRTKPEIGWVRVSFRENELFGTKGQLASFACHYDEVEQLPAEEFEILAFSSSCSIQAFQYRKAPAWGIQFHPEYNWDQSREIVEYFKQSDPEFFPTDELTGDDLPNQGETVVEQFLNMRR